LGLLLTCLLLAVSSFLGHLYLFEEWRVQHERQLLRAHILEEVLRLQHLSAEVETSFRGYLISEQRSFLEPLDNAEARLDRAVAELTRLTGRTAGLQAGVQVLSARLKEFIDSKKQLSTVAESGQRDQVHVYVRVGDGRALFLTIERAFRDFENRIERELPAESMDYDEWMQKARWRLLLLDSALVLGSIYAVRAVGHHTQRQHLPPRVQRTDSSAA
jgi:CHASE3 domain sensor protein